MIVFLGVAGAGKSLQGRMLADELAVPWLSTGEFLRMLVAGERRRAMIAGQLLSDHEIIALVQKILGMINAQEEFVLDGFPRTVAQADWLLSQVKHGQLQMTAAIHLTASETTVRKRLLQRGRPDDYQEAISERFQEYEKVTKPILDHFKAAGVTVHEIDGEQPVEAVHRAVKATINPQ